MWLRLKKNDGQEILVNMDLIVSIETNAEGKGSKLTSIAQNKDGVRNIAVQQPVDVIRTLLGVANEGRARVA